VIQLLTVTALAGAFCPGASDDAPCCHIRLAPAGSSLVRRVYAIGALASICGTTASLRGCDSVRWYLEPVFSQDFDMYLLCVSRSSWCCCSQPLARAIAYQHDLPKASPGSTGHGEGAGASHCRRYLSAHPYREGQWPAMKIHSTVGASSDSVPAGAILIRPTPSGSDFAESLVQHTVPFAIVVRTYSPARNGVFSPASCTG